MVKRAHIFFYVFLLFSTMELLGQSEIDGDLKILSELTLLKSPLIQRNKLETDRAEADYRTQRSAFDYQLSAGANITKSELTLFDADPGNQVLFGDLETKNTDFGIGLQKRFRTGLVADISSSYSGLSDNFPINRFNEEVGPHISDHTASATLSLTQPLLRNNGIKVTTAFEKSSVLAIESANLNFELNVAFEILQLGKAYWQYLGAYKSLGVFKENENRVRNVLEITEELVKADKKPESDLVQIKADLAQQERQTTTAQQNLFTARINLGRVIGTDEVESRNIGDPANEFPTILQAKFNAEKNLGTMVALARNYRTDIKAIENNNKGLELQLFSAKNAVLPQLDLTGFVTYGGAATGGGIGRYLDAFGNRQGRNHTIGLGLTFSFPLNNNLAKANFAKSKIALTDQRLSYENLIRNIDLNVSIAFTNLENSVVILNKAKETLAYYQEVFHNERVKFQNGLTTLLNLILFQERLTFAQLEHLRAQEQFATAILDLRFETGTLISMGENETLTSVDKLMFYTLPGIN